jgi:hypothetical protein
LADLHILHSGQLEKNQKNISRFSSILVKFYSEEEFDQEDWSDLLHLGFIAVKWLVENTDVKVTQSTDQVHLQPKSNLKRKKSKKG